MPHVAPWMRGAPSPRPPGSLGSGAPKLCAGRSSASSVSHPRPTANGSAPRHASGRVPPNRRNARSRRRWWWYRRGPCRPGVFRKRPEPSRDGSQDRREIGERSARGSRAALEEGVPGEHRSQFGRVPAHRPRECPGVCSACKSRPPTGNTISSSTARKSLSG